MAAVLCVAFVGLACDDEDTNEFEAPGDAEVEAMCAARTATQCRADGLCTPIMAAWPERVCPGLDGPFDQYAGCAPADRVCPAVITRGVSGDGTISLIFREGCLPRGWTVAQEPVCPAEGDAPDGS